MSKVERDDADCLRLVKAVLDAAEDNFIYTGVEIKTCGSDPQASVSVPASTLRRLLKERA